MTKFSANGHWEQGSAALNAGLGDPGSQEGPRVQREIV